MKIRTKMQDPTAKKRRRAYIYDYWILKKKSNVSSSKSNDKFFT
jgi:hypothetical protein